MDSRDNPRIIVRGHDGSGSAAGPKRPNHQLSIRDSNYLDKIRNYNYVFLLAECLSHSPVGGREDEKPWLFANAGPQPGARDGTKENFFYLSWL